MKHPGHSFELRMKPHDDGDFSLVLWELPPGDSRAKAYRHGRKMSSVSDWYLQMTQSTVNKTLSAAGYKPSLVKRSRKAPFQLDEEAGIRLDLAFRLVKGLRNRSRIESILYGLNAMEREEALYWHTKVTKDNGTTQFNGLKALRTLLGGG